MRLAKDTTLRYLKLLTTLPVFPQRISTAALQQKLERDNPEYRISARTMQRDMEKLSSVFPITCVDEGKYRYWFWTDRDALTQLPAMGEQTALTLRLAEVHLGALMPPVALSLLRPYFKHAREILKSTRLNSWTDNIRSIPESQALLPPAIDKDVQAAVYEALLHNRQLRIIYQRRGDDVSKEQLLNPLGLVLRKGLTYLVATAWGYTDPLHYALHRMRSAVIQQQAGKKPRGFSLDKHVHRDKAFSYPVNEKSLQLKLLTNEYIAEHLQESRLSEDQQSRRKKDGRVLITASVADTSELRWWILSLGAGVEVLGPKALRTEITAQVADMNRIYTD